MACGFPPASRCTSSERRDSHPPASAEETRHRFVLRIPRLHLQVEQRPNVVADVDIVHHEAVELVTMHRNVSQALIFPLIFLVHARRPNGT